MVIECLEAVTAVLKSHEGTATTKKAVEKTTTKTEAKAEAKAETAAAPVEKPLDMDALVGMAQAHAAKHGKTVTVGIVQNDFGVKKIQDVPKEKWAELASKLNV